MVKISNLILILVASNLEGMVNGFLEEVMKQGEILQSDFSKKFHDGSCRVFLRRRGSLAVMRRGDEAGRVWQSGQAPNHRRGNEYEVQLTDMGSMVIKRIVPPDDVTVFDTQSEGDAASKYFLGIRSDCVLQIHKGTIDEIGDLQWSNFRSRMSRGDSLGVSEIFADTTPQECYDHFMFMNPNGNLEIYEGRDFSYASAEPVWESNTKRELGDYRFTFDDNAVLSLHNVETDEQYWEKDLKNSGHPVTNFFSLRLISSGCETRDNGVGPYVGFRIEDSVFMRNGDSLPAGSIHTNGECTLFVQYDGRLDVESSRASIIWSSGKAKDDTATDDYFLTLQDTGNLVMYRSHADGFTGPLWETQTNGAAGDYFLSTNEFCAVQVYKGTPEAQGELVWSNWVTKLQAGDRLTKAQYFIPPEPDCGVFMALRPDNGLLGVYNKQCLSWSIYQRSSCFDYYEVWSIDAGLGEYDDYYVKVDYDGKLKFYGKGENGDEFEVELNMVKNYNGERFEVALCDENGSTLSGPIAVDSVN